MCRRSFKYWKSLKTTKYVYRVIACSSSGSSQSIHIFRRFRWFSIFVRPSAALYDSDTVVGCVSSHWQFTRCHSDHFRPSSMISDVFMEFPMFARLYVTYRYINGLSMHFPYYSIPIQCVTDLLRLCFDFIYSFGWLYYYYRFGLRSLWTISSIWSLRCHFNLSEVIFTYIYIALSFKKTITSYCVPPTFMRLHIALIQLWLRSPSFPGLISCTSTSIYFVLPRFLLILLWSRSIFCYIHRTLYLNLFTHLHSLSNHFRVRYCLYLLISLFWPYRNCLPELHTIRLCCLWCLCWFMTI